jgi:hypothetical protein
MKKISFISCGAALLLIVASVFAADTKTANPADAQAKIAELAKQVDALQAKITGLEKRLAKLETAPPIVTVAPFSGAPAVLMPHVTPSPDFLEGGFADSAHPPKIWGEGECNGWKFYTIPLSASGPAPAMPIPLANAAIATR